MYTACGPARSTSKRWSTASRPCCPLTGPNTLKKQSEKPMTLAETLLQRLADWRPAGEGRHAASFALPECGWIVRLTAERVDTVGCLLTEVEATRAESVADDPAALEAHAKRAAARATGLLEPLRLIEIDRVRNIALLRSGTPSTKANAVLYYEVKFEGLNRVIVRRYQSLKATPARTEPVAFALTHEALAKVVDDLVRE